MKQILFWIVAIMKLIFGGILIIVGIITGIYLFISMNKKK